LIKTPTHSFMTESTSFEDHDRKHYVVGDDISQITLVFGYIDSDKGSPVFGLKAIADLALALGMCSFLVEPLARFCLSKKAQC